MSHLSDGSARFAGPTGMAGPGVMEDDRDRSPRSDLVDLTGLDLDALASMPETVFTAALRRLVDERDRPGEDYCRFNSVIDVAVRPSGGSAGDSARTTR